MLAKRDMIAGVMVATLSFSVFLLSHVHQFADSNYSMLLSQSLFSHGSFTLDGYKLPRNAPTRQVGYVSNGDIYQLEYINDHVYYFFPPGSSILSIPYVAASNALGVSATNADGTYNPDGEKRIQAGLAASLMAAFAAIIFFTSRLLLPLGWSLLVASGTAFGTQVFSTASRALWSDTWGIFLLGVVAWMLLAAETGKHRLRPVMLATLLSWSYFVRPTYSLPILAITVFIYLFYRPLFVRYILTGALWFGLFMLYSLYHFGQALPNYYFANRLSFDHFWVAFAGNLISPSRGLLVFVPFILFIAYLLLRYARHVASTRLLWLCLFIIIAHLIVVSGFSPWWGGHCFGSRYTTGLVPWIALLGILAIGAWRSQECSRRSVANEQQPRRYRRWRIEAAISIVLLLCSVFINARGATASATWFWNIRPNNIDENPQRVWDWKNAQFLAR